MNVTMESDGIVLSLEYYTKRFFQKFRYFNDKPMNTPYDPRSPLCSI